MLKNVKIGAKLIGAFLIVAALCAAVGIYGAMKLHSTATAYDAGWGEYGNNANSVDGLRSGSSGTRFKATRLVALQDADQQTTLIRDLESARESFQKAAAEYENTISSDQPRFVEEDRRLFGELKSLDRSYEPLLDEIVSAVRGGQQKAAIQALVKAAAQGTALDESVQRLDELNARMGKESRAELAASATNAFITCLVVAGAGVLSAVVLGVILSIVITRPMKLITASADRVAGGDVNERIEYQAGDETGKLAEAFRKIVALLKYRADEADKIAAGDLDVKITAASENDTLGIALANVVATLKRLMNDMACMSRDHDGGDIDAKIPAKEFPGAYQQVATGINDMVGGHIAVKKKAMACIAEFGRGNFEAPLEKFPGKKAFINDTIEQVRANLKSLMAEMAHMSKEHDAGDIDVKIDTGKFLGDFQKVAQGINDMVMGHIAVKKKAMACLAEFGRGNFEAPLEKFPGKKGFINDTFEQVRANLKSLMAEMAHMSKEHDAGDIDVKIDTGKFLGDFQKVAQGINDMVMGHIAVKKKAMACLAEFGRGNFEAPLEKFPGKKAFINDTFEQVRANLKALISDFSTLADAAVQGHLSTRADAARHQGDFRRIVQGVNGIIDAVVGPLTEMSRTLDSLASGDLTVTVNNDYTGDFDKLKRSVNTLGIQVRQAMQQIGQNTNGLVASAEELNRVSQQMSASADETSAQANVVSAASEQVSKNIQTVATGADEMGASIKEIAKNTAEATRVALAAVKTAETTNHTIGKLGQSSAEIGQVIKVITSIAQQTNLLALNATIEAARAGEAGKGFAVVANEVKELAKETAKATEDISRKIEAIQGDTNGAVSAIAQISEVIHQISDIQNTIASAVEEQSATTNEISRNLAEAAKGGVDITKNISGVAEAARQTTSGAVDTQKSAQSLERMAADLQQLVSQFKYDDGGTAVAKAASGSRNRANGKYVAPAPEPAFTESVH